MVKYVRDTSGRFSQRPHYQPKELDRECESIINSFLRDLYGEARFPVTTEDLTKLVERYTDDLDLYADLSRYGPDVEGVTIFAPGAKPQVQVSVALSDNERRENRLRTTLTHEFGHVRFHAYLWEVEPPARDLLRQNPDANKQVCKRDDILNASQYDWMEWQAGYVCGAILMPASRVRRLVADYVDQHDLFGSVGENSLHGRALADQLTTAFQVSGDAARVRLHKLGVLGANDAGPSLFSH